MAVFCGSFNPPTVAHLALARQALRYAGEVLFVVPRTLPHKRFDGASFDQRVEMLLAVTQVEERFGVAISDGGLFVEIAHEARAVAGDLLEISLVCGRDAAERIVDWDYGALPPIEEQLRDFTLLVAGREGGYRAPEKLVHRVRALTVEGGFDRYSSTDVRRRIAAGEPWEGLVPVEIVSAVRTIYS